MSKSALTMSTIEDHGVLVVRPAGELTLESVTVWRSWLDGHIAARPRAPVIIDLSSLVFLDSTGMSNLLATRKRLIGEGVAVAFLGPQPRIEQWLEIAGLHVHLPIVHTMQEALAAVLPPPAR